MNILYLHGLLSSNQTICVDYLRERGHTVINPLLDYENDGNIIFSELSELLSKKHFHYIIGSSMGGFLALHLGNRFGIKTMLLNPALADLKDIEKPKIESIVNMTRHSIQ